jgi:hypothetical protein
MIVLVGKIYFLSNLFKFIQTCSMEFTVHPAGLSANSAGLSTKSAGIYRLGISLFTFPINWISTDFYRIRPVFLKTDGIGGGQFVSLRRFFKHCLAQLDFVMRKSLNIDSKSIYILNSVAGFCLRKS